MNTTFYLALDEGERIMIIRSLNYSSEYQVQGRH